MTDLPEPLTPPDCDLTALPFMPLHVARLRDSNLAALEEPEACWYAVLLWAASWHQVPAASLPDDDIVLARLCGLGRDVKSFRRVRAGALRGFVTCSDGRLYHPVVAEEALKALGRRRVFEEEKSGETTRKERERDDRKRMFEELREAGTVLPFNTKTSELRALHAEHVSRQQGVTGHGDSVTSTVTGHSDERDSVTAKTGTRTGTGTIPPTPVSRIGPSRDLVAVVEAAGMSSPPTDHHLLGEWLALPDMQLERDVLPVIRRVSAEVLARTGRAPFKLRLFDQAVREKHAADEAEIVRLRASRARSEKLDREQAEREREEAAAR